MDIQNSGDVFMGVDNGDENSHDFVVNGAVSITTGQGSLNLIDGSVNGILNAISKDKGSITVSDTDVAGTANLKTNGDGSITIDDLNVNAKANTIITTNGKGDISITDSTISGNAAISNNRNLAGDNTGKGSGKVEMENMTISGTADVSTGEGNLSLKNGNISGTASITSDGDGTITMKTVEVSGELTMTNDGTGAVKMDEIIVIAPDNGQDSLTGDRIGALLDLSGKDAPMETVLVGVIGGEKIKVDDNGDPIQAVDGNQAPLYLDAEGNLTTEAEDSKPESDSRYHRGYSPCGQHG